MGQVFHRNPRHKYPVAVGGDGPYIIDRDGKRYLDACGGAARDKAARTIGPGARTRRRTRSEAARSIDEVIAAE